MKKFLISILTILLVFTFMNASIFADEEDVSLRSEYAIVINLNDNRIMYEKNSNEKMYPASMTKMMCVLVALENIDDLKETYTFSSEVLEGLWEAQASVAGYEVGDKATYEDLLYGIMLPSGADASRAIAFSLFGSEEAFVEKMNEKADALKMKHTNFVNTSGLHDESHYTTVSDLAKLLKYALKNKTFKKIFTTHKYVTSDGAFTFYSTFAKQKLAISADTSMIKGTKTGFTYPASQCLASYAKVDKEEYIAITAQTHTRSNSYPYHIEDTAKLYNYYYDEYERVTYLKKEDIAFELPIEYGFDEVYPIVINKDISILCKNKDEVELNWDGMEILRPPLEEGEYIGTLQILEEDEVIYSQKYYLGEKMKKNMFTYYFDHPFIFLKDYAFIIFALIVIGFLFYHRNQLQNNYKKRKHIR